MMAGAHALWGIRIENVAEYFPQPGIRFDYAMLVSSRRSGVTAPREAARDGLQRITGEPVGG